MVVVPGEVMQSDIPAASIIRIVSSKHVHRWADGDFQNIACPRGINFEPRSIGPNSQHSSSAMGHLSSVSTFRIDKAKVSTSNVQPSINSEAHAIGGMICRTFVVTKSQILNQSPLFISHAVAIVINEGTQMRRMHQVQPVMIPNQTSRCIDLAEHFRFIGPTVTIQVA